MKASDLKYHVENADTTPHFFTRKTMAFFGDSMRNFGVRKTTVQTSYNDAGDYDPEHGLFVECWELFRIRPVKHGLKSSHYFDVTTFKTVSPRTTPAIT